MRRYSDGKPRQRRVATGLVFCLLVGGSLGLLFDTATAMQAGTSTPERTEYVEFIPESKTLGSQFETSGSQPIPTEEVIVTVSGAYLSIPSLTEDQVTGGSRTVAYTVKRGDSLWLIAQTYKTDISTLISLNPQASSTIIQPGEVLQVIPDFCGVAHTVQQGETLSEIAEAYGLAVNEIAAVNRLPSSDHLQVGQLLLLPGASARQERVMVASRSAESRRTTQATVGQAASLRWIWPITGGLHSSEFGQRWGGFHSGLDIAVPTGTPTAAVAAGTVTFAGWDGGYGYSVVLDHSDGLQTRYAHASKLLVAEGQTVKQGEYVILVGATGNSTGPHLHFEVLLEGVPRNPRLYLP